MSIAIAYTKVDFVPRPEVEELCSKRITVFVTVPCLEGLVFGIRPDGQILLPCLQPEPDGLGYC